MKTMRKAALAIQTVALATAQPALALGPVDGEVGAVYWANNFDTNGGIAALSEDAGAPGYRGELWLFNRYGVRAGIYSSDLDDFGVETSDYTSVDLLWRPFSPSENSFVAIGAGWHEMELVSIGFDGKTSGVRLTAEGRVGAGPVYFYGQGAYLPDLDEAAAVNPLDGNFVDLSGMEYEVGVSWKMAPFVAMRAGYRMHTIEFTRTDIGGVPGTQMTGEVETDGFLAGLSIQF